jgi:hypothetical protein
MMPQLVHIVDCATLSVMIEQGYGVHPWDGPPFTNFVLLMVRTTFTVTAASWSKTAFAATMLRFVDGWMKWVVWFIIVSMNIVMALNAMIGWVSCTPIQKSWNMTMDGTCIDVSVILTIGYVAGGMLLIYINPCRCEVHPFWTS